MNIVRLLGESIIVMVLGMNLAFADNNQTMTINDYNGYTTTVKKSDITSVGKFEDNVTIQTKNGNTYNMQFANQQRADQANDQIVNQWTNSDNKTIE